MEVAEIGVTSLGDLVERVTPAKPDPITGQRKHAGITSNDAAAKSLHPPQRSGRTRLFRRY